MKIGLSVPFLTGAYLDVAVLAQKAEELGFESIWVAEHAVMPVDTTPLWPLSPDGSFPDYFAHLPDPFVALARASAVTRTIMLGTGVCLVPEHNPLVLAKVIATLDHYSGGRFLFGIGVGRVKEKIETMGGDLAHRWTQAKEAVLAMKELWTKEEAEYHGHYYDFPPVRSFPKPVQKPHPPVLLGGMAENALRRTVAWADGWMPNRVTSEQIKASRATLDELAVGAGRDPRSLEITVYGQPPDREVIEGFEDAGAARVTIAIPGTSTDDALEQLDSVAPKVLP